MLNPMRPKAEIVDLRFDLYGTKPEYISVDDQQSLWVTCAANTEVVRLTRDGSIQHHPVDATPDQIASGGDSTWFTMPIIGTVGRIDRAGNIENFKLPYRSKPTGIATACDEAWVTLSNTGELARLAHGSSFTVVPPVVMGDDELTKPPPADPRFVAIDDRGSLWFTRSGRADIVRMDADGTTESWTSEDCTAPSGIAVDNEAVWIADSGDGGIWRIGRAEKFLQRVEPWPKNVATAIASDQQGGCWFTEIDEDLLGHIDADATLTEYDISSYGTKPRGLAIDRDGVVWVALWSGGIIGIPRPEQEIRVL
jgi:virginiamycin B lyase